MPSSNIIKLGVAFFIGITLGLVYGWVIDPVEYIDVPPNILREDYRIDYILMTAEAYQSDFDAEIAARRLAVIASESPASITASALDYATRNNFTQDELRALQALLTAMQTYQTQGSVNP